MARRWVEEVMNRRNAVAVDELMAPDFEAHALFHNPYHASYMQGGSWVERLTQSIDKDIMGMENRYTTIDQTIAAGDKVVTVATTTGTSKGKQVSYSTIFINRFEGRKIVEGWQLMDRLGVYQQLEVLRLSTFVGSRERKGVF